LEHSCMLTRQLLAAAGQVTSHNPPSVCCPESIYPSVDHTVHPVGCRVSTNKPTALSWA
jgi:hypothetical protein